MKKQKERIVIAIPVYNDWDALRLLIGLIDKQCAELECRVTILILDDFSVLPFSSVASQMVVVNIENVDVLRMRRNLGHQRAIAVGLCYIEQNIPCDYVVVMDGDGEDDPGQIKKLIESAKACSDPAIVFARRSKRCESLAFKAFYVIYKIIFKVLTGSEMQVGNFSVIPKLLLTNIGTVSEIWNHYASGLKRSRLPFVEIAIPRAHRLAGKSKMNIVSLVTHGLSSIANYGDVVGTRMLIGATVCLGAAFGALAMLFAVRLFTNWTIPGSGYTTYMSAFIVMAMFQILFVGTVFSMITLSSRNGYTNIPLRDYHNFVDSSNNLLLNQALRQTECSLDNLSLREHNVYANR